jgi:hypothetical protein
VCEQENGLRRPVILSNETITMTKALIMSRAAYIQEWTERLREEYKGITFSQAILDDDRHFPEASLPLLQDHTAWILVFEGFDTSARHDMRRLLLTSVDVLANLAPERSSISLTILLPRGSPAVKSELEKALSQHPSPLRLSLFQPPKDRWQLADELLSSPTNGFQSLTL